MKTFFATIKNWTFLQNYLWLFLVLIPFSSSFSQTVCRPTSQTNSTTSGLLALLCIGVDVSDPTKAYDVDPSLTTYALLKNTIGVGCFAEETLTFNQTSKAGDQIVIYFGTGNGLLDVGLLSNITVQAKNSITIANDDGPSIPLNNPLLNLQLLTGNTIGVLKYTLPVDANQIKIQTGGLLSLLVNLRVYDVRLEFAKPTVVGGQTQTVCYGQSISLSATAATGTTLSWYDSPTSTTQLASGSTFITPALTTSTTYYVSVSRNVGCESNERIPIAVNVLNPIAPIISSVGTAICSFGPVQATTLSVINPVPGTIYSWYSSSIGSTALQTGTSYTPTVSTGVTNFYVEAAIGICKIATRTQVNVTSTPIPALPTVLTKSVTIQSGQNATLNASTTEPGVVLDWYDVPTGGTAIVNNSSIFITPILNLTKIYYVEAHNLAGGCVSVFRVPVTVIVQSSPLGSCLEANSQQTNQNLLCLLCDSTNSNNAVDGDANTASRLSVPVGLINGWIQQTLQFNNAGKVGDVIEVDLGLPTGLLDLNLLSYISLASYNGTTFNNDRVSINSLLNVQLLGGNRFRASFVAGSSFDRVEIRLGGLSTLLTSLDIYRATYKYKTPAVSGNTTICAGQTTALTANVSIGEIISWYDASTGGSLLSSTATFTTSALNANTTYYVEVIRNGCVNSERFPVQIIVNNPIAPTIAISGTTICSGQSTTLNIDLPVAGTAYKWYNAASSGTLLFTGIAYTTPVLNADTSYYVEATIGSCTNVTRTKVDVIVNPLPLVPTIVSSNVTIQSGQSAVLEVSSSESNVVFDWYDAPTNGILLAANTGTYETLSLTTNTTYYITARNTATGCASGARAIINVVVSNSISNCLQANAQVTTIGGIICGLCSSNQNDSVDGDNDTAAHLSLPIGIGAYAEQMLNFATSGLAGDIIDVELGIPNGFANISALSNISLRSYNLGVANNDQANISSLSNIQILSGNRFRASFVTSGPFTSVEVRLSGVLTLLSSLDIYGASFRYKEATVTGAASPICAGQTATLTASSTGGETFSWYDASSGGNLVLDTNPTVPLITSTVFYLESNRTGCINSNRQAVTVDVLPIPIAADITIASPLTASCTGEILLSPTSALAGAQFKYFTDQIKTQEITSGFSGHLGVTYVKDIITGALTINGLNESMAPYNYYISIITGGICENVNNALKEVVVNYPSKTVLNTTTSLSSCDKVSLKDAITNFDTSGNTIYTFFDALNNSISDEIATKIQTSGDYSIQAQGNNGECLSVKEQVTVVINGLPTLNVTSNPVAVNLGDSVSLSATSTGTAVWYDPQGNALASNNVGPFNTIGLYPYTVIASNGTCTTSKIVTISVIDPASCASLLERVYANTQTSGSIITGTVTNAVAGVDGNPRTYATITTGLGILGVGTTWQNLQWSTTIAKGTPVTIKLGSEYSGVVLGQSISVIGTKRDGLGNPIDIGILQPVSGAILNLLSSQNAFEFTFVPSDGSGPKDYDGVRVQLGSLLSVAQNINVYDAYYKKQVTQITCGQGDIQDVFYGVKDLGVGVLTSTVGVANAWDIADNDVSTYATMYSGVGVLAAADLTTVFRTPSIVGDSLRIVISKPGTILNLNLLTGFSVQLYSGDIAVGSPIDNSSTLLSLVLLSDNTMAMTIVAPQTEPYDRVSISFGGAAGVLDFLRVHSIDRVTNTKVIGGDFNNEINVCAGSDVTLEVPPALCANYVWYDSPIGGNIVANGQTYTIPSILSAGVYKYYIQPIRYGCEALSRGVVTVDVKATADTDFMASLLINGGSSTTICSGNGNLTLQATLSATTTLTNPMYHWYNFAGTTIQLIPGEVTSQLVLTGLAAGTYTYYVGVSSDEYCETAEADRKQITFTILPNSNATDISINNASICHDSDASLTPTSSLINPLFFWYFDANKTQPISNGLVINGVTYTISAGGVLTASGLTTLMSPISYYVAVSSDNTCQNSIGQLKVATIIITDPSTPTTSNPTQNFCLINNPTVANIQVNEANVVWYSLTTGGTALASTTTLVNGIYYGGILDPATGCESSIRLIVTINVNNPGTPTTLNTTQNFCLINNPTVADIQVNEANVNWYNTITGGTAISSTATLTAGLYYGGILDTVTGCENSVRLIVIINVNDGGIPTTLRSNQDFCQSAFPKISDLQVNESNVVWYNAESGGTPLSLTALLTQGTYYASLNNPITGCESKSRLAIPITFSGDLSGAISESNAAPCVFGEATYRTTSGMSNYNWTVTNGTITSGGLVTDDFVTVSWPARGSASVGVSYSNLCNETKNKTLDLEIESCSDITITKTVNNSTPNVNESVIFTITVSNIGTGNFIDTDVSEVLPNGYAFVSAQATIGTYNNTTGVWNIPQLDANQVATLNIVVQVLPSGNYLNTASIIISNPVDMDVANNHSEASVTPVCLVVYNEFTPNNDGANDVFKIGCIENYPNNKLNVYNRYGALVYNKQYYNNDWDGTANVSGAISRGDKLPTGTYYYVIDIGADEVVKTGWLSIVR